MSWLDDVGDRLWEVFGAVRSEVRERGLLPLLTPVAPFDRPGFLAPAVAVGGLVAFLLLSGVAVTALGALLLTLLALYALLVEVFGFSIEVHPFGVR
ncbi:MAG TPA: hypothetical protein VKW76_10265 [Candidatus Binatia bacterium]|nr:hypothetical protein [Candidatus Binatia bacterium]